MWHWHEPIVTMPEIGSCQHANDIGNSSAAQSDADGRQRRQKKIRSPLPITGAIAEPLRIERCDQASSRAKASARESMRNMLGKAPHRAGFTLQHRRQRNVSISHPDRSQPTLFSRFDKRKYDYCGASIRRRTATALGLHAIAHVISTVAAGGARLGRSAISIEA